MTFICIYLTERAGEAVAFTSYCEGLCRKYSEKPRSKEKTGILYKLSIYEHAFCKGCFRNVTFQVLLKLSSCWIALNFFLFVVHKSIFCFNAVCLHRITVRLCSIVPQNWGLKMKTVFLYFFISRRYILVQISSPLCVLGGISWPVRAWVKGVRWYNQGLPSRVFSPLWRCPRWNTSQRGGAWREGEGMGAGRRQWPLPLPGDSLLLPLAAISPFIGCGLTVVGGSLAACPFFSYDCRPAGGEEVAMAAEMEREGWKLRRRRKAGLWMIPSSFCLIHAHINNNFIFHFFCIF